MNGRGRDRSDADKATGSSLDALREYGIDVAPLEVGYETKDTIIKYGKQLRDMRKKADMTQSQLAEAADMSQADISRLEKGLGKVGPSLDTMKRLAHACGHDLSISLQPQSSQSQKKELNISGDEAHKIVRSLVEDSAPHTYGQERWAARIISKIGRLQEGQLISMYKAINSLNDKQLYSVLRATARGKVSGRPRGSGPAKVSGQVKVYGPAKVSGPAKGYRPPRVSGQAKKG